MSDQIIIPVSADTSQMERQIQSAASNARVNVRVDLNAAGLENFSRPLGKLTGQADEFSKSMDAANARVLAFGASVGVVNAISNGFKELVKSTIEVEKSLTEISAVGGQTFSNLKEVSAGLFSIAKSTGTSFRDAAEATLEFSRQGKTFAESLEATKAALVLTRTTGIDAAESIKGLTSAVNSFSEAGLTMTEIVNKMAAVDAKFAVNSKDLIEGISRSASVAQEAQVSFDQLTALITTLQEKTGRGGAVIGNSLKTIFTRVQNPEILTDLRDLGVAVQDIGGNFLPATQILKNLAKELEGMDANLRKSVILKVGGGFQVDKLAAVLKDLANANGTYERSLSTGLNANGEAFARVEKINQTLGTSFDNLLTSAKELGSNIGQITFSKQFTDILQNGSSLIENLNKAIFGEGKDSENQGSKIGKAVLSGIGSVLSGPGVALGLGIFLKLSGDFVKFFGSATQTLLGLTTKTKEEESIQKSITNVLTNNFDIQERLLSLEGDKVAQANLLLNIYTKVAQQAEKTASLSKSLSPALYEGGLRMASGNLQVKGVTSAAGGYVPNLAEAIRNERQQAPSAAQIIVDHNFPMGGGQRGTMVYNSHETRISNFNNSGGDAIIPNYPVSAADGYVPNFAKSKTPKENLAVGGKGELLIDARKVPLAGITFAGEQNYLARAKGKEITNSLLKDYVGSPFFDKLREYDKIAVTNVPVGNVYRFRQGLKDKEENIKADFVSRLNDQLRPQLISFISSEIANLGLKPGKGLDKNLSNLKLNILGSSAAGYILEEIVKAPTLTSSEDVAKYAAQSEKSYFDIYGLNPEDAEAYGLPKQRFEYADVKLGQKELSDTLTKKFLNQAIYEGGGANKLKNAAKGYVPNFASKKLSPQDLKNRRSLRKQQPNEYVDFIELQSEPSAYITAGNIGSLKQIGKFSDLQVSAIDILQSSIAEPISPNARISLTGEVGAYNIEKFKNLSPSSLVEKIDSIKIERGYDNRDDLKKMFAGIGLEEPSDKLLDASKFEILNARTKKQPTSFVAGNIFEWAINSLVSDNFEKNNSNWDFEKTNPLTKKLFNILNVTEAFGDAKLGTGGKNFSNFIGKHIIEPQGYKTAAKGYIPNFATSNIQADILTANPMIGQMSLDSFIEKYIANNPGTGLRGTGGFVDAAVYQGENLSPEAKNDFIMSMLGINWLATFNRDKQANSARQSLINEKAKSTNRFRDEKVVDLANLLGGKEGGPNKYRSNAVVDPNNVVEGAFSGSVKELKYEDLHSLADNIFSKAGVADVFNRDIVATMYKVAMQMHKTKDNPVSTYSQGPYNYTPDAAAIGHEFDYLNPKLPKVENEYSIIKRATQQLRPILIQGLLENDKNAQALLLNPPKQDLSVVGDSSKYLALLDPNAANLRKYISGYLLNPSIEPLKERSEEAISNKINLTSIRSFLDEYHQASFSRKPVSLDTLKSMRAKAASNSQLRKFFSEGPEGAFKEVSMGYRNGKKTGLTAWWNENLNQLTVDNINNILSASINREGIFQLSNLDFKFNGVAPLSGSFDELHTFANSPDFNQPQSASTASKYPPDLEKYIKDGSIAYGDWKRIKDIPAVQEDLLNYNLKGKYNPTTKRVDIINALKGFIPNFAELTGANAGMLYNDPNYTRLGSGTSGMFLAPNSGEGMGQKIFFKKDQDKIKHEYHVNKSLKEFEKSNPSLFAENAISFTEVGDFLTQNGLLAGFQRQVIKEPGVDEFATNNFPNRSKNSGDENVVANYAYHLSEFMAQAGAKHIVEQYRKLYNDDTFRLQDVYAGNFKVNSKMQEFLIAKTLQRLPLKKKIPTTFEPYSELRTIFESGGMDIFNHEIGSQGGRNIMFDTMGFSRNAAKGFVPNFADSSEIVFSGTKITKEQLKKFLSSKLDRDAIDYINNTAPNRLTNQLRSNYLDGALGFSADDKSLDKFRNYTITAANGYIPNFAAGIQEAIVREKMATGLPDSMIKVSVDNRAKNDTYNPSGLIVTNKIDEPHGASDVSSKRMFEAYGNAAHGHVPNFADKPAAANALSDEMGGGINFAPIEKSNTKLETAITNLTTLTRQQIATLIELNKTELIQNSIKSVVGGTVTKNDALIFENLLNKISLRKTTSKDIAEAKEASGLSGTDFYAVLRKAKADTTIPKDKVENTQSPPNQTPPNPTPPNPQNEVNKKSFTELAGQLFALQTGLSFLSGALGSLGEKGELAGKIVNDLGQSIYAFTQGGQLLGSLKESKSVNAALEATKGNKFGVFSGLGAAADAAKAAGGGLGGSIGVLGAAVSSLAVPAAFIYGLYTAGNTVNSFLKLATDQSTKTAIALGKLTDAQKQYSIGLTDQQKAISDSFVKKVGNVEASTAWDRLSFIPNVFKSTPKTEEALKSLNQEAAFNAPLLQSISQITSDDAYKQFKSQTGKNKKSLTDIEDDLNSKKIEQLRDASLTPKKRTAQELRDFEKDYNKNTFKFATPATGAIPDKTPLQLYNEKLNDFKNNNPEKELDLDKLQANFKKILEDAEKTGKSTYAVQKTLEASLGVSISYLKTELSLRQQIAQSILETKTSQEYSLDYEKELLTTSDQRKDSINLELQLIQKNRDLRKEKLTLAAGSFETELTNSLQSKPGGISTDQYNNIKNSYQKVLNSIQNGDSNKDISNTLKGSLKQNGLDEKSAVAKQLVKSLENQLNTKDLLNSKDQQALIIADKINQLAKLKNYLITSEKEKLDNILKISEKELSIAKERSQLKRSIQDVTFERSILSLSPAQQELARGQYTPQQNYNKAIDDIRNRNLEADSQTRRNLINLVQQKNPNLNEDEIAQLPNKSISQLQKAVKEAFEEEQKNKLPENRENLLKQIKEKAATGNETALFVAAGDSFKTDVQNASTKLKTDFLEIIEKAAIKLGIPSKPESSDSNTRTGETEDNKSESNQAPSPSGIDESVKKAQQSLDKKIQAAIRANTVEGSQKGQKTLADENFDLEKQKRDLAIYQNYTFKGGAESSMQKMQDDIDSFRGTLGKQIPNDFRDAMAGAMKGLADTTKPFKDSLLNVALAFTQKIQDALFTNLANQITAPLTGAFTGHASGGPITGGSGAKDDVPAMLMGGEYVIKKSAAQKYGITYLNALNNGTIKKFADGGLVGFSALDTSKPLPSGLTPYGQFINNGVHFDANGQAVSIDNYTGTAADQADAIKKAQSDYYLQNAQNSKGGFYTPGTNGQGGIVSQQSLFAFATQNTSSGQYDRISGGAGVASIDLAGGSENLTISALKNKDNLRNAEYLDSKNKALDLYFGGITAQKDKVNQEEQARLERERIQQEYKTQQRQMYQGILRSMAVSAAVAGVSALGSAAANGWSNVSNAAKLEGRTASFSEKVEGIWSGSNGMGGLSNAFSSSGYQSINQVTKNGVTTVLGKDGPMSLASDAAWNSYNPNGVSYTKADSSGNVFGSSNTLPQTYQYGWKRAAGGYIPGQEGAGDNVPAMLSGGEFVMSKQAASNIGYGNLQQMNSGGKNTGGVSDEMISRLEAKLEELVQKTSGVGTINISVDSNGKSKDSEQSSDTGKDAQNRELAKKVKDVVLDVLRQEKRLGGMLR
jgi:TP901 family phage tail tape measure protein